MGLGFSGYIICKDSEVGLKLYGEVTEENTCKAKELREDLKKNNQE